MKLQSKIVVSKAFGFIKSDEKQNQNVNKEMTNEEYQQWNMIFKKALTSFGDERDTLLEEAATKLEYDFELLGATAIEDKL